MKRALYIFFFICVIAVYQCQTVGERMQVNAEMNKELLPVQQPIIINGGDLPPLNVFHNPVWMKSSKVEEESQNAAINKLAQMNAQLDAELQRYRRIVGNGGGNQVNQSFLGPKFTQINSETQINQQQVANKAESNSSDNSNEFQSNNQEKRLEQGQSMQKFNDYNRGMKAQYKEFPQIASIEEKFQSSKLEFINKESAAPLCIRREGLLKIRDADLKEKEVNVTYAVLTKERLSYFVNSKDESSIQGSIELDKIKESIKLINGFSSCFTVKTLEAVSDCSICAESEDSAREWINAITQNAVNCNTLSNISNLSKRGMLK